MSKQKKAQIAIFMIIALVILIGGGIFLYSTQKTQKQFEPEIKAIQEQVPVEFDPVKNYANDCAYSAAVEGLKIIGKQGGYIDIDSAFVITSNPTESDAVTFARNSDLKIPYWWYLKSPNNCRGNCAFGSKRPELRQSYSSIEKQLERYIDSKFTECVNSFEPFTEQGYKITETGKAKTDVTIASEDVSVLVEYPVIAERQNTKSEMRQFSARVPLNLDKLYELATKTSNLEIKNHFLEKHVLNLIAAFSGVDRERLPPMSDMQFKFGSSTSWQKTDVKNKLTGLLASYIPLFQVDGTYNYERILFDSELKQRLYDSTIIPVANSSFSGIAVSFSYLDFWPAYFDLNCKGEICRPSSANSIIPIIGLQTYRFNYDLSFPVMVEMNDPFALNGKGYNFNFFLEGNIRNNQYMEGNFTSLDISGFSEKSQLCDVRTSGNVTVNVIDAVSKKPIDDAQVLYTLTGESCFIGPTNSQGSLAEQFPVGVGGFVNIVKEGYIGKSVEFDPQLDSDSSLNVELQPIYTKNIIVKKKNIVKTPLGWQFDDTPVDLSDKESVTITLTRIGDDNELEFSSVANYEGQQKEKSEIEIAPGNYVVSADLLLNGGIVIPEKEKSVTVFLFVKKQYTMPKVDFGENFPEGGLRLNLTISPSDIEKSDTLVFYVVSIALADVPEQQRDIEDLDQMGKLEEYSNTYQLALQPEFEK